MPNLTRRDFMGTLGVLAGVAATQSADAIPAKRPNILFAMADDWSWPHASVYGETGISTPNFDRVAREGCLFDQAFTAAPQCAPNRAAILTGRNIWQLEEAGTHGSIFPNKFEVYPDILEDAGYHVGYTGKPWGPGNWGLGGWERNPAGDAYNDVKTKDMPTKSMRPVDYAGNFEVFLDARPDGAPFSFWFGCHEPHRNYERGSGVKSGKKIEDIRVPSFLPDTADVRSDLADYYLEIEWFDTHLGRMLDKLEAMGELDNTLVIVTGDNGMPFPGAKANLYEYGTHVPFAIRWPTRLHGWKQTDQLVSFVDIAPTILTAAGITPPQSMTGSSILPTGPGGRLGRNEFVLTGRERHSHARYDNLGYPARAIRTPDFLYIWNVKPDRWPAGDPDKFYDIDASPTKDSLLQDRQARAMLYDHSFAKRPEEELYSVADPSCLKNLAADPANDSLRAELRAKLLRELKAHGDPRVTGNGDIFESYPRFGQMRPHLGGFHERTEYNPKFQQGE